MRRAAVIAVCAAGLFGQAAAGQEMPSAKAFIDLCVSPGAEPREACETTILGLMNTLVLVGSRRPDRRVICPVWRIDGSQARQIVVDWTNQRPWAEDRPFHEVVVTALRERFPCTGDTGPIRQPTRP